MGRDSPAWMLPPVEYQGRHVPPLLRSHRSPKAAVLTVLSRDPAMTNTAFLFSFTISLFFLSLSSTLSPPQISSRTLGSLEIKFLPCQLFPYQGEGKRGGNSLVLPVRTLSSGHHPSLLPHPSHRSSYPGQLLNLCSSSADLAPVCILCSSHLWPRGPDPACIAPPASLQA